MKICIYGAALDEIPENYRKGAEDFGRALAKRGHSLLFGGGKHGCMGAVARGVAAEGGEVSAITPDFLNQGDDLFQPCHRVVRTRDLAERKQLFSVLGDAFVVLPGGIGTMDEYYEMYELASFGKLKKPLVLFNMDHYYDLIEQMNRRFVDEGFLPPERAAVSRTCSTAEEVLDVVEAWYAQG